MQRLLNKRSQAGLASDGDLGKKTVAAVSTYQSRHKLAADAIVGSQTWRALVANTPPSSGPPSSGPPASRPPAGAVGSPSQCGNTGKGVFLVFDDYPLSLTRYKTLIDQANRLNIGIGIAPNGQYVKSGRADIGYAKRAGMYPVDHTYDHQNLTKLSYNAVYREITTSGVSTKWGRPPYGALNDTSRLAYKSAGMNLCLWNLDPQDWNGKSARSAADYIIRNARRRSTIVVHMNHMGTDPTQLNRIQSGLARRGITMCRPHAGSTSENWRPNC